MKHKTETSAGGVVFKKVGDRTLWLITQHSQHKHWGFPKGLVGDEDTTESKETAAIREVHEEGGVVARIVNPIPAEALYKYTFEDTLVDKKVYYFLMEYVSGDPKDHDWEVSDAKFVTEDEVRKSLTYRSERDVFAEILRDVIGRATKL